MKQDHCTEQWNFFSPSARMDLIRQTELHEQKNWHSNFLFCKTGCSISYRGGYKVRWT